MSSFNVSRDNSGEAWFRIGRFDVTSTVLLVALGTLGTVVATLAAGVANALYLDPRLVLSGQVWRIVTWPFVDALSLWTLLSLVLLWYFGRDLEAQVGRRSMAALYIGMWASLTAISLVVHLVSGTGQMYGLGLIQFLVLLLWIAEYPQRPFFFGIRAWVVGAVLLGLQVLLMAASGRLADLLTLLGALVFTALMARRFGLLSELNFLPRPKAPSAPRPARKERRAAERRASDAERIDQLLEKISNEGLHSLTAAERRELEKLRQRRQG
ncbi:MAG TPA: rhomboid family intramembrane serine protease [Propioniciclava sp.]|uniref:rhomboid family intramembrane serine protease n=1 Tax=Propioniciclava sp. TaxID=2038686 RepID=UPI002B50CEE9|nr:rhomboid family intramembrane serine protease [Propioniciclava sp.]HRL49200.1 rhomboid family intramembrane serine protease [Propioniciclava sp.]HRL79092.1 rhomboid family intramembrane serine protease [Propioniciclava sp.]